MMMEDLLVFQYLNIYDKCDDNFQMIKLLAERSLLFK